MTLSKVFKTEDAITPFILRISLAIVIFPHGYQKIGDFTNVMGHLTADYGLPRIVGLLVVFIEFFGPVLLLGGVGTRLMALLTGSVMVGAIPYHWKNGFFMNWFGNQAGEGFEYHLLAIGIALALVFAGGGKFSIDRLLYRCQKKQPAI